MNATASGQRAGDPRRRVGLVVVLALVAATVALVLIERRRQEPPPAPPARAAASKDAVRRFFVGLAHLQVGQLDASIAELTQATQLAPGEAAAWANLGLAHLRQGSHDAAQAALDRAAELAPEDADVAYLRARLEASRGRADEAVAHLRRTLELQPAHARASMALAESIETSGRPGAASEALRVLDDLLARDPGDLAVLVERARVAAKAGDAAALRQSVARIDERAAAWPEAVVTQWAAVKAASEAGDAAAAARAMAFLRNVLVSVPDYVEARERVTPSEELIAEPLVAFRTLAVPRARPSPADDALTHAREPIGDGASVLAVMAVSLDGEAPPAVIAVDEAGIRRIGAPAGGSGDVTPPGAAARITPLDWNHDFRMDLLATGPAGARLHLASGEGWTAGGEIAGSFTGAWPVDVEMDGDLDALLGSRGADPVVLRNNGDGTWLPTAPFPDVGDLSSFAWGDLDDDGDADAALLDGRGTLHVRENLQGARFQSLHRIEGVAAFALGDVDADGRFDLVTLRGGALIRSWRAGGGWRDEEWTSGAPASADALLLGDLDANGALDVIASSAASSQCWLAGDDGALRPLAGFSAAAARVVDAIDLDGDGMLDLLGIEAGRAVRFLAKGTRGWHVHVVRPRAVQASGDARINTFGIGGTLQTRSGLLVQTRPITGPTVHVGLGARDSVDVTRIAWPNGTPQAEFAPAVDVAVVAQQRLKGSCPWIFADDGTGPKFVTDFIWRSPLGLRINAQDTAGVTQTEDWVRIRGDQLVPRDGVLDVRITAELWETHFIDHVSLLVVDHPSGEDVFVDERFVPVAPPALELHSTEPPRPIAGATMNGEDVSALVARRDGAHLARFRRGHYQGLAEDHFVEIDLGEPVRAQGAHWLVAHGFIYPTDSSINLALGQGRREGPRSLSLEAQDPAGSWIVVAKDLGFPAGKNKTILLDLGAAVRAGLPQARRFRLRTNLEIAWDSIEHAHGREGAATLTQRLAPDVADLRHRGFSVTIDATRGERPEVPVYDRLASRGPRWRDLAGHYTRYGDVRELLAGTDDRYLIMNAGDEIRLRFPSPPPPAGGLARDYVLIGDGWVKDGDYNTGFSKTVHPLPSHGQPDYVAASASPGLWEDPVFLRHRDDWATYHVRHVEPRAFVGGLALPPLAEPK